MPNPLWKPRPEGRGACHVRRQPVRPCGASGANGCGAGEVMWDVLWAMVVGPLMWVPGFNILIGLVAGGWSGAFVGLVITIFIGSSGASNEHVRRKATRSAKSGVKRVKAWWQVLGVRPDASREEVPREDLDRGGTKGRCVAGNHRQVASAHRGWRHSLSAALDLEPRREGLRPSLRARREHRIGIAGRDGRSKDQLRAPKGAHGH